MISGKTLRFNKIFREDGRALVVAMDHASGMGPVPGIENPCSAIEKLVAGGMDAIMTNAGVVSQFGDKFGRAGVIVRMDGGRTALGTGGRSGRLFGPGMALSLGADAVCSFGLAGVDDEYAVWSYVAAISEECQKLQVPYMVEALPRGEKAKATAPEKAIAIACRTAAEFGADFIKTAYAGTPAAMAKVVSQCYIPILILGGPKLDSDRAVLEMVAGALDGGAAGFCMGRNLWQHEHPDRIVAAVAEIMHRGSSIDAVLKQL